MRILGGYTEAEFATAEEVAPDPMDGVDLLVMKRLPSKLFG
jgi:hypothetical protein